MTMLQDKLDDARQELIAIGSEFGQRRWAEATSGNYSCVVDGQVLITASGRHKARLGLDDFVLLEADGTRVHSDDPPSSAETQLHLELVQHAGAGAVLHAHTVWNTVLSHLHAPRGFIELSGWEMLKALPGIGTHETTVQLKIYDNTQDIPALADDLRADLRSGALQVPGFLLRGHGLYAWGADLAAAHRHTEAFEFLLEVVGRLQSHEPRA